MWPGPRGAHFCRGVLRSPHCSARRARGCGCSGSAALSKLARSLQSTSRTSAGATFPVNSRTGSSLRAEGALWGSRGPTGQTRRGGGDSPVAGPLPPDVQISAGKTQSTSRPHASLLGSEAPGEDTGPQDTRAQALPCAPQPPHPHGRAQHAGWYSPHPQEGVVKEFLAQGCGHRGHIVLIPLLERAQAPITTLSGSPRQVGPVTRSLGA